MNGNPKIWLDWEGRNEAWTRASNPILCNVQYLHAIGKGGSGNVVVWGNNPDALCFASRAAKVDKFDFAYVNPEVAVLGKNSDTERLSALLEMLVHVKNQISEKGIVAVRPVPHLLNEETIVLGNVFPEWNVENLSVLRGKEGYAELAVACSDKLGAKLYSWQWWPSMVEACCPEGGKALFVGLDEASVGYVDCAKIRVHKCTTSAAFVFPLGTVAKGYTGYNQQAAAAWNKLQEEAAHNAPYFCGLDAYEMCFIYDRTAGPQRMFE